MKLLTGPTRRVFVPEVVQTSQMDCGPASLKALLEGFSVSVSYGRLREACQTAVDGTSIDTLEDVAVQLGLDAQQSLVPLDHVFLEEANILPAIAVVVLPNGLNHFIVLWRIMGGLVQVMDPGVGRRWVSKEEVLGELYRHRMPLPAETWREWAGSSDFVEPLKHRMRFLAIETHEAKRLVDEALEDPSWQKIATLDAAIRFVDLLVTAGGLRRGAEASRFLQEQIKNAMAGTAPIPDECFVAVPCDAAEDGTAQVTVRGGVLVRVFGRLEASEQPKTLPSELVAALNERPARPGHDLLRFLLADGHLAPAAVMTALLVAAGGLIAEAVLFRSFFDIGERLGMVWHRVWAIGILIAFMAVLLALEVPITNLLLSMGRRLEARLRIAFLEKVPRLGDQYFRSRQVSDMAERCHSLHSLRLLPTLGGNLVREIFELVLTTAGIIWLDPASAPQALLVMVGVVAVPLAVQPMLVEQELRARTHAGSLSRYYLDALLGLVAIRTHGAERAVRREHEGLLVEWTNASMGLQRTALLAESAQLLLGYGMGAWLVFHHVLHGGEPGRLLLLVYWTLNLPVLGTQIALMARQYPSRRNVTLRLMEPLGALEEAEPKTPVMPPAMTTGKMPWGVSISLQGVSVVAGGNLILDNVDLEIPPGSHIALVGASGAGKSSLAGLLLGWHRAASGQVLVDGAQLAGRNLTRLRRQTAWVDPAVQLWNKSMLENLMYGNPPEAALGMGMCLEMADLQEVLERMENGLQTELGESGGMVSGGEGQRVRLARAFMRERARLIILDEPFRGLERTRRTELLGRARIWWERATLLCITHDLAETMQFSRVLVVDQGRIVEDGPPKELMKKKKSHFRALVDAEEALRTAQWEGAHWRRWQVRQGQVHEKEVEV